MGSVFRKQSVATKGNTPDSKDSTNSECVCHIKTATYCGICNEPTARTKPMYCPLHPQICGEAEITCNTCKKKGLELISGTGGPDQIIDHTNNKTYSESELTLRPYVRNFE